MQDNHTTSLNAKAYHSEIRNIIPYYDDLHEQTLSMVRAMELETIDWLDLGCGTGILMKRAQKLFDRLAVTMADPSEEMLEEARKNNADSHAVYLHQASDTIDFVEQFHVVTAVQAHHYMKQEARRKATQNIFRALRKGGIYLTFENVVPDTEEAKAFELRRWGRYQKEHGRTEEEIKRHIARCDVNYFPLTVGQHMALLTETGFRDVHLFWYSYMQAGFCGRK